MLNHIDIMGRLVADPELRYTQNQTPVCSFCIANEEDYVGEGGKRKTHFVNVVAWRRTAEFVSNFFKKGSMAIISGSLQSREWQDDDGKKRVSWEVVANSVYFGNSKIAEDKSVTQDDGELPF